MRPNKVMVIDDSKLIHKMFSVLLPKAAMISALDGREALARLAEHADIDLIFLDINMPTMNGLEFLRQIKEQAPLAEIPVIIVSTEGREEDTVRGLKAGAAAYVRKPFRAEAVLALVERVLARGERPLAEPDHAAGSL